MPSHVKRSEASRSAPGRATRVLGDVDIRSILTLDWCIELQRQAFLAGRKPNCRSAPRTVVEVPGTALKVGAMVAVADVPRGTSGCKVLTSAHPNRDLGWPRSMSTIVLVDVPTGFPLAVLGGTYLTNARTAATAVLAVEALRVSGANTVGLFGAGPIARLILEGLAAHGERWQVLAYSPTPEHRQALAHGFAYHPRVRVRAVDNPKDPAACPTVITATDALGPAFDAAWLKPNVTVVSVASRRAVGELAPQVLVGARLVADDREAARHEAAEFAHIAMTDVIELGEVLDGSQPGRGNSDERWVFKATGVAVQDIVTAEAVLRRALELDLGIDVFLVA